MKKYAIRDYSNEFSRFVQPCYEIPQFTGGQNDPDAGNNLDSREAKQAFEKWEQEQYDITLGEFLLRAFPSLFGRVFDVSNEDQDSSEEAKTLDTHYTVKKNKRFDIICHGLSIDLNTPLYWLQLNMGYLDNFIYLSFHSY